MDFHVEYTYFSRTPKEAVDYSEQKALLRLWTEGIAPKLVDGRTYTVKLKRRQFKIEGYDTIHIRWSCDIGEVRQEVVEYIDYRPMDWWELSLTATEEMKRRFRLWWKKSYGYKVYLLKKAIDYKVTQFERNHFGASF
jgi:hypothetical protein